MTETLSRGAYSESAAYDIEQIHYMGGGHPGCGGFCEALQIELCKGTVKFILHNYHSDCYGNRSRWCEFASREELTEAWKRAWTMCQTGERFGEWHKEPWWKT